MFSGVRHYNGTDPFEFLENKPRNIHGSKVEANPE